LAEVPSVTVLITRNLKPVATYHQWLPGDITQGDVLGVFESLGNRAARSVTIESIGGESQIRFNVIEKVFKAYNQHHQPWIGLGQGLGKKSSPLLLRENKIETDLIVIPSDTAQEWLLKEIQIRDIEVVLKSSGLRITVT
jgi:hypothetical protein